MIYAMVAVFSLSMASFVFQASLISIYQPGNLKRLLLGWGDKKRTLKNYSARQKKEYKQPSGRMSMADDIELLLSQQDGIRVFGIRVRSMGDFYVLRIILPASILLIFILLGFLINRNFYFYSAAAAFIFYFLIREALKGKVMARSRSVLKELPDVIDLMASLVSAGLTLDESVYYISKNFNSSTGKLFYIYRIKILEGKSRAEALDIIGRLSFCTEFKSFIKVLYQSEIIGNPVKDILAGLSRVYRNNQRDFLKIRAERMESNLIVVIFIFIFIPMLMIFLLPAIPQLRLLLA